MQLMLQRRLARGSTRPEEMPVTPDATDAEVPKRTWERYPQDWKKASQDLVLRAVEVPQSAASRDAADAADAAP